MLESVPEGPKAVIFTIEQQQQQYVVPVADTLVIVHPGSTGRSSTPHFRCCAGEGGLAFPAVESHQCVSCPLIALRVLLLLRRLRLLLRDLEETAYFNCTETHTKNAIKATYKYM